MFCGLVASLRNSGTGTSSPCPTEQEGTKAPPARPHSLPPREVPRSARPSACPVVIRWKPRQRHGSVVGGSDGEPAEWAADKRLISEDASSFRGKNMLTGDCLNVSG